MGDQRTDAEHVRRQRDLFEFLQATDVDEPIDDGDAQTEHRQQRLAAGNRRRRYAVLGQCGACGLQSGRADVVEGRGLHAAPSRRRARSIASDTRRGVSGVSLKLAPIARNASATALAITAGGAIAPPSPRPLTPYSVARAGVTAWAIRTVGISGAHGTI